MGPFDDLGFFKWPKWILDAGKPVRQDFLGWTFRVNEAGETKLQLFWFRRLGEGSWNTFGPQNHETWTQRLYGFKIWLGYNSNKVYIKVVGSHGIQEKNSKLYNELRTVLFL